MLAAPHYLAASRQSGTVAQTHPSSAALEIVPNIVITRFPGGSSGRAECSNESLESTRGEYCAKLKRQRPRRSAQQLGSADMSLAPLTSKDVALQAVGRTVVNFQRLEHNLKLAARLGPVAGTLPKIQRDLAKRIERSSALTLGQAIHAWLSATDVELVAPSYTPDFFDATMHMTFSLGTDDEMRSAHGTALKELLAARNNLIHGGLVHFEWDSPEDCSRLVKELDKINELIRSQLDFVTSLLRAISAIRPEDTEIEFAEDARKITPTAPVEGDA